MKRTMLMAAIAGAAIFSAETAAVAQSGEQVFRRCQACHVIEQDKNRVGPSLYGVVGREANSVGSYPRYSDLNAQAAELGLVWTKENIVAYLPNPQQFLTNFITENGGTPKGRTSMPPQAGLSEEQRAAVVDYIQSQSQ
jgi:cytochrome c